MLQLVSCIIKTSIKPCLVSSFQCHIQARLLSAYAIGAPKNIASVSGFGLTGKEREGMANKFNTQPNIQQRLKDE